MARYSHSSAAYWLLLVFLFLNLSQQSDAHIWGLRRRQGASSLLSSSGGASSAGGSSSSTDTASASSSNTAASGSTGSITGSGSATSSATSGGSGSSSSTGSSHTGSSTTSNTSTSTVVTTVTTTASSTSNSDVSTITSATSVSVVAYVTPTARHGLANRIEKRQIVSLYLAELAAADGSAQFALIEDESAAMSFEITDQGQLIAESDGFISFANEADVNVGYGNFSAAADGGEVTVQFAVEAGDNRLVWRNPLFTGVRDFYAAPCIWSTDGVNYVLWQYIATAPNPCNTQIALQAFGGDLPGATVDATTTDFTPTGTQTFTGTTPTEPGSSTETTDTTTDADTSTDTDTSLPTDTGDATVTETATDTLTSSITAIVTVTTCQNWPFCDLPTSTLLLTSTTLTTEPCTTALPIPTPISGAPFADNAWFIVKCAASISLATLIGYIFTAM
ncbi:hypothetical protein ABW19_dt0202560 [Dactylella cylindrospora]|nr:hypothetical protein ABW19_dt0202560 [Dactylella cylindrospora]